MHVLELWKDQWEQQAPGTVELVDMEPTLEVQAPLAIVAVEPQAGAVEPGVAVRVMVRAVPTSGSALVPVPRLAAQPVTVPQQEMVRFDCLVFLLKTQALGYWLIP